MNLDMKCTKTARKGRVERVGSYRAVTRSLWSSHGDDSEVTLDHSGVGWYDALEGHSMRMEGVSSMGAGGSSNPVPKSKWPLKGGSLVSRYYSAPPSNDARLQKRTTTGWAGEEKTFNLFLATWIMLSFKVNEYFKVLLWLLRLDWISSFAKNSSEAP